MKEPRLVAHVDDNHTWWLPCHVELGSLPLEDAEIVLLQTINTLKAHPFNGHLDLLLAHLRELHHRANQQRNARPNDSIPVTGALMHLFFRQSADDGWQLGIRMTDSFSNSGTTVFGIETFRYLLANAQPAKDALADFIGTEAAGV